MKYFARLSGLIATTLLVATLAQAAGTNWTGTWATSPLQETRDAQTPLFENTTLVQVMRVSRGGEAIRLRLSNAFGKTPLKVSAASVTLASVKENPHALTFAGKTSVDIPEGSVMWSDELTLAVGPLSELEIALTVNQAPKEITGHPGARANSWWASANPAVPFDREKATRVTRWYFVTGIDVRTKAAAPSIALLGDSITDGYGVQPGTYQRWTDKLAERLQANSATADIGVLNHGIGGNRLLRDGLGPNILARFERDVLAQSGVKWLVVFGGINDIGTRVDARKKGEGFASADDIIAAYQQLIHRSRLAGIKVIGATITPYRGADFYWTEDGEADRQRINAWIRSSGNFHAVIDFDALLRDPAQPDRLQAAFDSGDHLHPSMAGYARMGESIDLTLFNR